MNLNIGNTIFERKMNIMPKLQCKVNQCAHNASGLCAKNYIDVDGPEAHNKKETFCCCMKWSLFSE